MKKTLLLIAAVAMAFISCNKDGGKENEKTQLKAEVSLEVPAELQYGQPAELVATIVTDESISGVTFVGAKKEGETYTIIGENQPAQLDGNVAKVDFFADNKEITDVAVFVTSGKKEAQAYFPTKVTGELDGTVWFSDPATFKASPKVATHENDAAAYPNAGTGAGCDMPSYFSMHGVKVGNEWKHIVSLSEARPQDGKDVSFAFVNVLENTAKQPDQIAYIGSQRGFAFCNLSSLTAGTVGRQCDAYAVDGHEMKKLAESASNFKMRLVRGSWKGAEHWNEAEYKFIDALFLNLNKAQTNLEKMQAYYQLGQIQRVLDSATLVPAPETEEELTSFGGTNLLRQFVDLGPTAAKAPNETWRAGDYILFRSARTVEGQDTPKYYYGIMQIQQIPDINNTLVDVQGKEGKRMDNKEEINNLFGKPLYASIKIQCELK